MLTTRNVLIPKLSSINNNNNNNEGFITTTIIIIIIIVMKSSSLYISFVFCCLLIRYGKYRWLHGFLLNDVLKKLFISNSLIYDNDETNW